MFDTLYNCHSAYDVRQVCYVRAGKQRDAHVADIRSQRSTTQ